MSHEELQRGVGTQTDVQAPADQITALQRPHRANRILNHANLRTAAVLAAGAFAVVGVSDVISSCSGGPIQQATEVANLGAVLDRVAVPRYPVGIMEGDGVATGEVVQAKYLHVPKIPVIGFLSDAVNGVLGKLYSTHATSKIQASVELLMDNSALSLKPYRLDGTNSSTTHEGVEAVVKVGGLTSVLVSAKPIDPTESSGEGLGSAISGVVLGNGNTTQTDNAATDVAESYFQNVCGRALLGLGAVGIEHYVQNLFRLDGQYFSALPNVNPAVDQELERLSLQPVHVVFTHDGKPVPAASIGRYVNNFGPPIPDSKNVAKLVDNTPSNVKVPGEFNGCMSTTSAIAQQENLIQQAAVSTAPSGS